MLPPLIKSTFKRRRARALPKAIAMHEYDILVFQEAFHHRARQILRKQLKEKYPFQYGPANRRVMSLKTNSGVWVLSKFPLKLLGTVKYTDCQGVDCWGRKGAVLLEGQWQGQTFQLLGTHLESGPQEVRNMQYPEIRGLIDRHKKAGVPQLLCGDFNTNKSDKVSFEGMMKTLDAEDGELINKAITLDGTMDDFKQRGPAETGSTIIDFIFYRGNGHQGATIEREARQFEYPWHKSYKGLADHNAVEMRIKFK